MGKQNKTKLLARQILSKNFVENGSQTDELEQLSRQTAAVDESTNLPTSSADFCDLTKEQLVLRLKIAQELNRRQQRALEKSESFRIQQKQVIQELCHKVKMLVIEHRENHSEFKRIIANLVTVFANGRKELAERLDELRITTDEDKKQMRDSMASNEVATVKAKTAVKQANDEINEMVKQLEKMQLKIEKIEKDRVFIKQQYDELVDKRNQQIITQDFLCPKCKATKKCLDDVLDDLKATRESKKKAEEDSKNFQRLYNETDAKLKEIEKIQKRIIHERDTYKEHLKAMEKKPKKNNFLHSSPLVDGNVLNGKSEESQTPRELSISNLINSPQKPQSGNNSPNFQTCPKKSPKDQNLEDGEVVEDEETESEAEKKAPKRSSNESPGKKKKQKIIDYVYIIEDEPSSPLMTPESSKNDSRNSWRGSSPEKLKIPPIFNNTVPRRSFNTYSSPRKQNPGPSETFFRRSPTYHVNPVDQYGNPMQRYRPAVNYPANGTLPWHDPARITQQPRYPNKDESWTGWRR